MGLKFFHVQWLNKISIKHSIFVWNLEETYMESLKWEVLPHPSYSPGIEKWLDSWLASKNEHFYRIGIWALPERWSKVVANDEQHFEWYISNYFFTIKLHFRKKESGTLVAHLMFSECKKLCHFKIDARKIENVREMRTFNSGNLSWKVTSLVVCMYFAKSIMCVTGLTILGLDRYIQSPISPCTH